MAGWRETAHPRFGFLTLAGVLTGAPGPEVAALQLRLTEAHSYLCVPAGAFGDGFAVGLAEVAACDDNGDAMPDEIVEIEFLAVPIELVQAFGEAQGADPVPFGAEGLWPEVSAVLMVAPEGFGEEADDFASALAGEPVYGDWAEPPARPAPPLPRAHRGGLWSLEEGS